MPFEPTAPKGWFVRTSLNHDGSVVLTVMQAASGGLDLKDRVFEVRHERRWWQFWAESFEKRLNRAVNAAQKRAWTLNQQYKAANKAVFTLQNETKKANPHDD